MDIRGDDLRALRAKHRITGAAIARALGVTKQRVYNIERQCRLSPATLRRYLDAFAACEAGR